MRRSLEDNKATGKAGAFEPQAGGYRTKKFDMGDGTEIEIRVQPSMSLIIIRGEKVIVSEIAYVFGQSYPSPSTGTAVMAAPKTDGGLAFYPEQSPLTVNATGASNNWVSTDKKRYATYVGGRLISRGYRSFAELKYPATDTIGLDGSVFPTSYAVHAACIVDGIGPVYAHIQEPADESNGGTVALYKANKGVTPDDLLDTLTIPNVQVAVVDNAGLYTYVQRPTAVDGYALFSPDGKKLGLLARPYGLINGDINTNQAFYNDFFVPVLHEVALTVTDGVLSAAVTSSTSPYQYGHTYTTSNSNKQRVPVGASFVWMTDAYSLELCYVESFARMVTDIYTVTETLLDPPNPYPLSADTTASNSTEKYIKVICGNTAAFQLEWTESSGHTENIVDAGGVDLRYKLRNGSLNQRMAGTYLFDYDPGTGVFEFGTYDETKTSTVYEYRDDPPGADPTVASNHPTAISFTYTVMLASRTGVHASKAKNVIVPDMPSTDGYNDYGRYILGGAGQYLTEWSALGVWVQQQQVGPRVVMHTPGVVNKPKGNIIGMFDECAANMDVSPPSLLYDKFTDNGMALEAADFIDTRVLRKKIAGVQDITASAPNPPTKLSIGKYPPP